MKISPNQVLDRFMKTYNCAGDHEVEVRKLIPEDIRRPNWLWNKIEYITPDVNKLVVITGFISPRLFLVKYRLNNSWGDIIAIHTNGDSYTDVFVGSLSNELCITIHPMDEISTDPYPLALCGIVAERKGLTIAH
jgi:hypothetical protein